VYIQQLVYISCVYVDWLLAGSCQQSINITHDIPIAVHTE